MTIKATATDGATNSLHMFSSKTHS